MRIERIQGGVALLCRKATPLIEYVVVAAAAVRMRVEVSEVGLTQSEHLSVTVSKLYTRRYVLPYASWAVVPYVE